MFEVKDNLLIVDRITAEQLFLTLGCVNVDKWDADLLAQRLKQVALFCDAELNVGEFQDLLDAIMLLKPHDGIVLRSSSNQKHAPTSFMDQSFIPDKGRKPEHFRRRGAIFSFKKCGIPKGATLVLKRDPTITCKVIGDPWIVDFGDNVTESFSQRTRKLLGVKATTYLSPMHYWMYDGRLLRHYYRKIQKKV